MTVSKTHHNDWQNDEKWDRDKAWFCDKDWDQDKSWVHVKDWEYVRDWDNDNNWDHDGKTWDHADWRDHFKDMDLSKLWEIGLKWVHERWLDGDRKDDKNEKDHDDFKYVNIHDDHNNQKDHDDGHADWVKYGDYHVVWDHQKGHKVLVPNGIEPDVKHHDGWVEFTYEWDGHEKTLKVWGDDDHHHGDWHDIA